MKKATTIFTSLLVLTSLIPAMASAQEPFECEFEYTVQSGDWLSTIAQAYYGDDLGYLAILEANNTLSYDDYTDIPSPDEIEPGWLLCIPPDGDATTGPHPEGLSPEALANTTYQSEWTQSGTAPLIDGEYREAAAPGSATETVVRLTDHIAYGQLNGGDAAAVVLVTDPGGSGTFYDLAVVVNQGGQPVNLATTRLGDRVLIYAVSIIDNEIVVYMLQAGPDDPLCCPSQQVVQRYALQGDRLVQLSSEVIETLSSRGGLTPDQVTFDPQGLAEAVVGVVVPATPYDVSDPLAPEGHPDHVAFAFDDEFSLAVYPIAEYQAIWETAGNSQVTDQVDRLKTLLAEREGQSEASQPPMPILPPTSAVNDLAAQFGYLDFNRGSGVRYVGRVAQEAAPVTNDQLNYYFQGLSEDGQYYVSFIFPIWAHSLPDTADDVSAEGLQQVQDDFDSYRQQTTAALNGLSDSELDWLPPLSMLDALVQSITIHESGASASGAW